LLIYKYFVGGILFESSILRVLCCLLSWETVDNNTIGMEKRKTTNGKYMVDVSVNGGMYR
jgi:hypothetical protein